MTAEGGGTKYQEKKSVPLPLCSPQISHGLTRVRHRLSAVTGRRLTAWVTPRPFKYKIHLNCFTAMSSYLALNTLYLHCKDQPAREIIPMYYENRCGTNLQNCGQPFFGMQSGRRTNFSYDRASSVITTDETSMRKKQEPNVQVETDRARAVASHDREKTQISKAELHLMLMPVVQYSNYCSSKVN